MLSEIATAGNSNQAGRLSTVDLIAPTCFDMRFCINKTFFYFLTKQANLVRRSIVLGLPFQFAIHGWRLDLNLFQVFFDTPSVFQFKSQLQGPML
jgi:hypothetical protein